MNVHLIRSTETDPDLPRKVVQELDTPTGPLSFRARGETLTLPAGELRFRDFFDALSEGRARMDLAEEDFLVLLTDRPNAQNWFARFDEQRNVFIHTADWNHYVACDAEVAIAYQVVTNVFQRLTFSTLEKTTEIAHKHPIGCIDDLCMRKRDMNLKIRTGDICLDCLRYAKESGVSEGFLDQILQTLEDLRGRALFSPRRNSRNSENLPFSVAFTQRKLRMTTEPLRQFLCLLDYFDSLIRTTVLTLGHVYLGKNFEKFCFDCKLSKLPSLGHWVYALKELSKQDLGENPPQLPLSQELQTLLDDVVKRATEDKIVSMRNSKRAHGYLGLHDKAYEEYYDRCLPCINDLNSNLFPILENFEFHYVREASRIGEDRVEIVSKKLMGDHPDFPEEKNEKEMKEAPIKNRVYAVSRTTGQWHDLHDSLVYEPCETCNHERLLISDGEVHLDIYSGHRSPEPEFTAKED